MSDHQDPQDPKQALSVWQTMSSIAAAMFGVQSSKVRERDFARGKVWHFVLFGVLAVAAFIGVLVVVVRAMLNQAGL